MGHNELGEIRNSEMSTNQEFDRMQRNKIKTIYRIEAPDAIDDAIGDR